MRQIQILFIVLLIGLLQIACEEDTYSPFSCSDEGEAGCYDGSAAICSDGVFYSQDNCSESNEICLDGGCSSSTLSFLFHNAQERSSFYLDVGKNTLYLVPFQTSPSNQDIAYEIKVQGDFDPSLLKGSGSGSGATSTFTGSIPATASPTTFSKTDKVFQSPRLQDRPRQFDFDRYQRVRQKALWSDGKSRARRSTPRFKAGGCTLSTECGSLEICENGICTDRANLYFDGWSIHSELTAYVLRRGTRCAILVDKQDVGDVSEEDLDELLNACENVIVPRDRFFFGSPLFWYNGEEVDFSDPNGDGLLHVLLSYNVNREEVWGFFNSADFFPDDDASYPSNERDMIYVALPQSPEEITSIEATIIHEYEHVLNFTNHTWAPYLTGSNPNATNSPVWLDEALAHASEEIGGYGVDNSALAALFLQDIDQTSLTGGDDSIAQRGMGMMLMVYLMEQAGGFDWDDDGSLIDGGGADFLQQLIFSEKDGIDSLEEATGRPFEEFFFDWLVTLIADGTELSNDSRYNYEPIRIDPLTGGEVGILTHGERSHPSISEKIPYSGPAVSLYQINPFEDVIRSTSAKFLDLTGLTGSLKITISTSDPDVYLGVITHER